MPTPTVKALIERDAATQKAFIQRWSPLIARVTNARHRKMLALILGEMNEHLARRLKGRRLRAHRV